VLTTTITEPATHHDGPGSRIGPYKLLQQIGEGGFGIVFMAEQEQPVRRRVALKIVKPGMDSAQVSARFEAERQALAMMDHQNIARVFDAGTTPAGRAYFVMELVHGIKITKYCDDNHLSLRERLELFIPVCQAIQHAHQKGIIHRDVKPSNVLVTLYDGKPVPKVIDFGVAKAIDQRLTERTMFTQFGMFVGTFEYMAPEQAEMNALGVDTRSDIYSLGVLLYELLTGSTPLSHDKVRDAVYSEVLRMIKEEEAQRPSARLSTCATLPAIAAARKTEPSKLARLIRGELDWIVLKCLEKDRARRYETANALVRDLQRFLADEPIEACPPSAAYRVSKLARRHKKALLTGAAFLLVLIAAAVVSTLQAIRATLAETEARSQRDVASKARSQAEAVTRFLTEDVLFEAAPERNPLESKVTVEEVLRKAARKIERNARFEDEPEVEAALRLVIGNTLDKLGQPKEAAFHLRRALELRRKTLGPDHPDTLTAQEDLAFFVGEKLQQPEESERLSRSTWEARLRILGPDHPKTLESLDTLGGALRDLGRLDEAEDLQTKCLEGRRRELGENHKDTLQSMNNLSVVMLQQGRIEAAEALLLDCLARTEQFLGAEHVETLSKRNNLAKAQMDLGKFAEAESTVRIALAVCAKVVGPRSVEFAHLQYMLVRVLVALGRWEDAERASRDIITLRREIYPSGHLHIARALATLGLVLVNLNKAEEAESLLSEAVRDFRDRPNLEDWTALAEVNLGTAMLALGRVDKAEFLLEHAWPRFAAERRIPPWQKRQAAELLAKLYEQAGRTNDAAAWRSVLEEQLTTNETHSPNTK
jgi:non-specific serine/threonine protein kinase/serine/threonine-protein kinase